MGQNRIVDLFGHETEADDEIEESARAGSLSTTTLQGRYAEFMICAYLTRMGLNVLHVDATGFDLILEFDGASYRIDVKSTGRSIQGPFKQSVQWRALKSYWSEGETTKRRRKIGPNDADLLALFYTPLGTVVFYPVVKPIDKVRLPMTVVRNAGKGENTLHLAIAKLLKHRSLLD